MGEAADDSLVPVAIDALAPQSCVRDAPIDFAPLVALMIERAQR